MADDIRRVACNYAEATNTAKSGSIAFVLNFNYDRGCDRLYILSRSRSGRWVRKWEASRRLTNFRLKTIPADSPLYRKLQDADALEELPAYLISAQ